MRVKVIGRQRKKQFVCKREIIRMCVTVIWRQRKKQNVCVREIICMCVKVLGRKRENKVCVCKRDNLYVC